MVSHFTREVGTDERILPRHDSRVAPEEDSESYRDLRSVLGSRREEMERGLIRTFRPDDKRV